MRLPFLLAALLAAAAPAGAQTVTLGVSAPPANLDPHYYTLTPSNMVSAHMFETLVRRDEQTRFKPGLAASWRLVDDTTWEFTLRDGVRFHDGSPLTAEDVAYTLRRVPTVPSPGSFAIYTRAITGVEVVDPRTVRLKTAGPYPLLPNDLSQIFILPRGLGPDVPSTAFNSGAAAIGTGPFRLRSYKPGDRIEMARNDEYWGDKPAWARVDYRIVTNGGARVAALLSGDVDLIDNVPTTDLAGLRKDSRVAISEADSFRLIFIGLDEFRDGASPDVTGPNGEALDRNPLRDIKVRQAMSMAINRPAIVERTMEGAATAAGQFMPPGTYGYAADLSPPRYDPQRARALLAEAGYPNGFSITLRGPNDRYVNDAQILQVVAQQWTRIGIKTQVDAAPLATQVGRFSRFETSAFLLGWSNTIGEPSSSLRGVMGTRDPDKGTGLTNYGRYSNPAMDAITAKALRTLDDREREGLMRDAMRLAMEDVALIPLHTQKSVWATKRGLSYTPRLDEQTLAVGVRPAS